MGRPESIRQDFGIGQWQVGPHHITGEAANPRGGKGVAERSLSNAWMEPKHRERRAHEAQNK
jgi:hypothetical protein